MATAVALTTMVLYGSGWTGTGPGPGNPTISGTISSSTDFSDHMKSAEAGMGVAAIDFTNFGSGGFDEFKPGIKSINWSLNLYQDYAASSVDSVFGAAYQAGTLVYLDLKPTNSARGTTNPSIVGAVYVQDYPVVFSVGEGSMVQIKFMSAGKFARLTS